MTATDEASGSTDCGCTRRRLLTGAAAVAGAGLLDLGGARMAFAAGRPAGDLLVVVTLAGGADALSLVPPLAEPDYLKARPGIGVRSSQALALDRRFGLHPGLAPLLPLWRAGTFGVVHAVGDADGTRSHFEAAAAMERGVTADAREATGWIDRHLTSRGVRRGDFPAFAVSGRLPLSLAGPAPDLALRSLSELRVGVSEDRRPVVERALAEMHAGVAGPFADAARGTLDAMRRLGPTRDRAYVPRPGVTYPAGDVGAALQEVARVARAGVGLEVACVTSGGWDTHEGMGSASGGAMASLVERLGAALAAFARDLGPLFARTTVVTLSEFGRRVQENGSGGVDHGHGGVMLLMGGGVVGGRVHGRWPGLAPGRLDEGDLRVTTDYRDVLGEVVRERLGNSRTDAVFPRHRVRPIGVTRPR